MSKKSEKVFLICRESGCGFSKEYKARAIPLQGEFDCSHCGSELFEVTESEKIAREDGSFKNLPVRIKPTFFK